MVNTPLCPVQGQSHPTQPQVTPAHVAHLSQQRLLPLLGAAVHQAATAAGLPPPLSFGQAVVGLVQLPGHVELEVEGLQGRTTLQAAYVVAADGANSSIRCVERLRCGWLGMSTVGACVCRDAWQQ